MLHPPRAMEGCVERHEKVPVLNTHTDTYTCMKAGLQLTTDSSVDYVFLFNFIYKIETNQSDVNSQCYKTEKSGILSDFGG